MSEPGTAARLTNVDATEHYRQRAERLETNEALLGGVVIGTVATYLALLVWQLLAGQA